MKPDQFLERFLLPLVAGGTVHVGPPLGATELERLVDAARAKALHPTLTRRLDEARWAVANEVRYEALPPPLDVASLRLAVAVHDMLYLLHPSAAGLVWKDRRLARVAEHAAALARLPRPLHAGVHPDDDAAALVARHSLLHQLPLLGRTDVRVTFWAGRREFHGTAPPKRLLAWRSIRQVREERWRAGCFSEAAAHPLAQTVLQALLEASPLTDLLHPLRVEPRFSLGRVVELEQAPALLRLVAYSLLELGLDRVGATLAQATLAELSPAPPARSAAPPPQDKERPEPPPPSLPPRLDPHRARFTLAFFAHVHLCFLLGQEPRERRAEVVRLGAAGEPGLRDCFGLFAALVRAAPPLATPPDGRRDPRLAAALDEYAAACEAACGAARVAELAAVVTRALTDAAAARDPAPSTGAAAG